MLPDILPGLKTYIAAIGFFALGVYQFTQGDVQSAIDSFAMGLAAWGLRSAIDRPTVQGPPPPPLP